jgi:hypothetical protein
MGKSRRGPRTFVAKAEQGIDAAWRRLRTFKSERPDALLRVITATDGRLRIYMISMHDIGEVAPRDGSSSRATVAQRLARYVRPN